MKFNNRSSSWLGNPRVDYELNPQFTPVLRDLLHIHYHAFDCCTGLRLYSDRMTQQDLVIYRTIDRVVDFLHEAYVPKKVD
jgi:hypothetical protein